MLRFDALLVIVASVWGLIEKVHNCGWDSTGEIQLRRRIEPKGFNAGRVDYAGKRVRCRAIDAIELAADRNDPVVGNADAEDRLVPIVLV